MPPGVVEQYGSHFSIRRIDTDSSSPIIAINEAVGSARGRYVMINIDGARILTLGVLSGVV